MVYSMEETEPDVPQERPAAQNSTRRATVGPRYCRRVLCGCPEGCQRQVEDRMVHTWLCWSCSAGMKDLPEDPCRCGDLGAECCRAIWVPKTQPDDPAARATAARPLDAQLPASQLPAHRLRLRPDRRRLGRRRSGTSARRASARRANRPPEEKDDKSRKGHAVTPDNKPVRFHEHTVPFGSRKLARSGLSLHSQPAGPLAPPTFGRPAQRCRAPTLGMELDPLRPGRRNGPRACTALGCYESAWRHGEWRGSNPTTSASRTRSWR